MDIRNIFFTPEREENLRKQRINGLWKDANSKFNIKQIDGKNYIVFDGVRITPDGQEDLVGLLQQLKEFYVKDNIEEDKRSVL